VSLAQHHSFVRHLDQREVATCARVADLVRALSSRQKQEVERHVVVAAMDKDLSFGYDRTEHEYWMDQAIYRLKLIEERSEGPNRRWVRARPPQGAPAPDARAAQPSAAPPTPPNRGR
jgi:hypothetical protein